MRRLFLLVGLLLVCLLHGMAWAGDLACKVQRSGAPEPGVTVVLTPGGARAVTDAAGLCKFPGLAAGTYSLHASKTVGSRLYGAIVTGIAVPAAGVAEITVRLVRAIPLNLYLPVEMGYFWQYRMTITETMATTAAVHRLTRRERPVATESVDGVTAIVVHVTYSPGTDEWKETVRSAADGYTRYWEVRPEDKITFLPPLHIDNLLPLGYPINVSATLHHSSGAADETFSLRGGLAAFETVRVPAGTFVDCARLNLEQTTGSESRRVRMWLARGLGIVRMEEESTKKKVERVLEEYRTPRPLLRGDLAPPMLP